MMYEIFDHTADLGLRITAPDLPTLLAEAGRGLCAVIVSDPESVQPTHEVIFEIAGTDAAYLLFDWLHELVYTFETRRMLFSDFSIDVDATGLRAIARGEPVDRSRHQLAHEVKAITYHELDASKTSEGWTARVIVDI